MNKVCRPMSRPSASDLVRFWAKVTITPQDGCWEWAAFKSSGYGQFYSGGHMHKAHRYAWMICHGNPQQFHVLHRCDNPACVRPDHLFLGHNLENARDRATKGRSSYVGIKAAWRWQRSLTHCKKGHPLSGDNVRVRANSPGYRYCHACRSNWSREGRIRRAAAIREGE